MLSTQLKSLTDLRTNPLLISQLASDQGPVYILNRNKPISVILDVQEYENLLDQLQDARDATEIKELKKTASPDEFVSHDKLFSNLGVK